MGRSIAAMGAALAVAIATSVGSAVFLPAAAAGDDAAQILKAMSDYLASQKTISATYNSDIEVITPDLQKIQFNSSGTILMNRPDEIRATRIGGLLQYRTDLRWPDLHGLRQKHQSLRPTGRPGLSRQAHRNPA